MTPEQIQFIRKWAASGRIEPRLHDAVPEGVRCVTRWDTHLGISCVLNQTGFTIAALAEENDQLRAALEQACETAEYCSEIRELRAPKGEAGKLFDRQADARMKIMRGKLKELLG